MKPTIEEKRAILKEIHERQREMNLCAQKVCYTILYLNTNRDKKEDCQEAVYDLMKKWVKSRTKWYKSIDKLTKVLDGQAAEFEHGCLADGEIGR